MSNKFSQESPHISNPFSRESPHFQTCFHGSKRYPRNSKEWAGKQLNLWISKYMKSDLLGEWTYRCMYINLHTTCTWHTTSSTFKRCADLCTHTFHVVCILMTFVQICWGSSAHTQRYDIWEFCTQHVHDTQQVEHVRVVHIHLHASIYSVYVFEYA